MLSPASWLRIQTWALHRVRNANHPTPLGPLWKPAMSWDRHASGQTFCLPDLDRLANLDEKHRTHGNFKVQRTKTGQHSFDRSLVSEEPQISSGLLMRDWFQTFRGFSWEKGAPLAFRVCLLCRGSLRNAGFAFAFLSTTQTRVLPEKDIPPPHKGSRSHCDCDLISCPY